MLDKYILHSYWDRAAQSPHRGLQALLRAQVWRRAAQHASIDLSFAAILKDLDIPPLAQHDAFNDALMTAMMYVALRDMKERGIRIPRLRTYDVFDPTGA